MKDKFTIEILLKDHFPKSHHTDSGTQEFMQSLSVIMMIAFSTQDRILETFYLRSMKEEMTHCLS